MHWVDLYWLVVPLFRALAWRLAGMTSQPFAGTAGLFFGVAARTFGRLRSFRSKTRTLADSMGYDNG